jgi:hypothetical protein
MKGKGERLKAEHPNTGMCRLSVRIGIMSGGAMVRQKSVTPSWWLTGGWGHGKVLV